jgi:hypothetical protein
MEEWVGDPPRQCDLCHAPIGDCFIDGKTDRQFFPWACMCPACHAKCGGQLGLGLGQMYQRQGDRFVKVADVGGSKS